MKHTITIEYCSQCRWMHRATWMMQELFVTFQEEVLEITLRQVTGGNFNVYANGDLIFSPKGRRSLS